jgi:hypothetical protein
MKNNNFNLKTEKALTGLSVIILVCYFAVFAYINFKCFAQFCEQDMYADTLVAKLMWEQKTLFPLGYVFGNQLYVVATPVLSALFYGLTGSPNTAMALATTVMSVLVMISFCWMVHPFLKNRMSLAAAALLLVSCAFGDKLVNQEEGQLLFVLCSYYACYAITLFVVLGDYARSLNDHRHRPVALTVSLLLCFATGMQSLRQTCIMVLPILAFQLLLTLRDIKGQKCPPKSLLSHWVRPLLYTVFNALGLLFVIFFNVHQYKIFESQAENLSEKLHLVLSAIRGITGLTWATAEHPFFILMFVVQILLLVYATYLQLKSFKSSGTLSKLWWLLVISLAAVVAASLVTSLSIRSVYLFVYYPLLALSMAVVLEDKKYTKTIALILCLISALNLYFSYVPSIKDSQNSEPTWTEQIADWAVENGYELVYGGHSYVAPSIAAYSDGALTAGCWNDEIMFKSKEYLNIQNIYSLEDVERAIFVFQPYELDYAFEAAQNAGAELTFQGQYGELSVYTSTVQLMYPRTYPWFEQLWYED